MNLVVRLPRPRFEALAAALVLAGVASLALGLASAPALAALDAARIGNTVRSELKKLDVPSASVAIVVDGRVAYLEAMGQERLEPQSPASTTARFEIGSNSKQFLAAGMLMLQEEGKLSLDDKVGKYLPDMGPAGEVTLRQLLSHTAGIRDYWPQDYVFTRMLSPISHEELLDRWARQPLDFPPGERWQYSNTGYVVAGLILEKVSGEPLFAFLRRHIFAPLHMASAIDLDATALESSDAVGYTRNGLGPLRPAVREGKGWLFAAGELAMTAEDLARWDISIMDRSLMHPASYRDLESEVTLANGIGSRYALGLSVKMSSERRVLAHNGGTSGFTSRNVVYPDQRAAVVVLTNSDAADAATSIADKLQEIVFESVSPIDLARQDEARRVFDDLRQGKLDRTLLSPNANDYFTADVIRDIASSSASLGEVKSFKLIQAGTRGGMDFRAYEITLGKGELALVTRSLPDGKLEQFMIYPK
jgi:CubicO group peptidase (beta-lactamase class C family)